MSHGGGVSLMLWSIEGILQAMEDLHLTQERIKQIETTDGRIHQVEVSVRDENGKLIGFEKQADGSYQVVSDISGLDTESLKKQKRFINRIKQRYAHQVILQELNKQGYQVTEEKGVAKDTIKLVARRWVN